MSLSSRSERACHPERRRREGSASESPTMTRLGLMAITCLLFAAALAFAQQPPSGPGLTFHARYAELAANPRNLSGGARLGAVFRLNWEYVRTDLPQVATYVGYPRQNARR